MFRTIHILKIINIMARITLFKCFEIFFLIDARNFCEILPSQRTEAVEDRDVTFNHLLGFRDMQKKLAKYCCLPVCT